MFITNGPIADVMVIIAVTDKEKLIIKLVKSEIFGEGVEKIAEAQALQALGVDFLQGYQVSTFFL
jgi:alkylation response protein AidB-like acyl-CoA dehydrogenase